MRTKTNLLIEMMDEGVLRAEDVVLMALNWLSEDEVADMMRANDILEEDEEGEDE